MDLYNAYGPVHGEAQTPPKIRPSPFPKSVQVPFSQTTSFCQFLSLPFICLDPTVQNSPTQSLKTVSNIPSKPRDTPILHLPHSLSYLYRTLASPKPPSASGTTLIDPKLIPCNPRHLPIPYPLSIFLRTP